MTSKFLNFFNYLFKFSCFLSCLLCVLMFLRIYIWFPLVLFLLLHANCEISILVVLCCVCCDVQVANASWDVNGNDADPEPRYNYSNENRCPTYSFFFFFFSPAEYNSFPYLTRLTSSVPRVPSAARLFLNCMMASEAVRVKSTEV